MEDYIESAREHYCPVGMYGLGVWGSGFAWRLFAYLGIDIDFVTDGDVNKLVRFDQKGIKRITCSELLDAKSKVIVFVMIGQYYIGEVLDDLGQNENLKLITLNDVLNCDVVLEKFYEVDNIRGYEKRPLICPQIEKRIPEPPNEKIAIYTCIINGYDEVMEPLAVEDNCDYFLISDKPPKDLKIFQWINYKDVVPDQYTDYATINRYCKMHAHEIFSAYRYSIYLDGKVQIVNNIKSYIYNTGKLGISLHKHGFMDCIYVEGIRMVGVGISNSAEVIDQMRRYLYDGMPRHYGTFECRVVVRDHNNISGNKVMEEWFEEYYNNAKRDQFSLSYVLWKNGWKYDDVGLIKNGISWDCNEDIKCRKKHLK